MWVVDPELLEPFCNAHCNNHLIGLKEKVSPFLSEFRIITQSWKNMKETVIARQPKTFRQEEDSFFQRDCSNLPK
jgi:hypothetical protein